MAKRFRQMPATQGERDGRVRHAVLDRRCLTIALSIVVFFVGTSFLTVIATLLASVLEVDRDVATIACQSLPAIVFSLGMLVAYQHCFARRFDGMLRWSWQGLALVLPSLAFAAVNLMELTTGAALNPLLPVLLQGLAPGISEEIVFRAIPASNWMRVGGREDDVVPCVLATSFAFSLVHAANLTAGAALSSTVFQVTYAFALGVFFCAVMLRTGSIWPTAVAHTVIDVTAMLFMDMGDAGVITEELTLDPLILLPVAILVALAVLGLYLVRPSRREEIVRLWDEKWGRA